MITTENSCQGKTRYETLAECNKSKGALNDKGGTRMSSYHCQECNGYHFGHFGKGKRMIKYIKKTKVNVNHKSSIIKANTRFLK